MPSMTHSAANWARTSSKLKVGYGMEDGVTQGPLIDVAAVPKVSSTSKMPWPRAPAS